MGLVTKDKVRGIDKNLRETIWLKQGKNCYVTGLPLAFADAVGAHIIPHELGGKTDASNVVIVHKTINAQMGSQNLELYKKAYQATLSQ
jgi:5-methylcytosine-specific restriction endonuclease McrA